MDENKKAQLLNNRKILQERAPIIYQLFARRKMKTAPPRTDDTENLTVYPPFHAGHHNGCLACQQKLKVSAVKV